MSASKESDTEKNSAKPDHQIINRNESQTTVDLTIDNVASDSKLSESLPDGDHTNEVENEEDTYINLFLRFFPWYHGIMFSELVGKLVKVTSQVSSKKTDFQYENAFLVRRLVQKSTHRMLCITLRSEGKLFNYRIRKTRNGWRCNELFQKFSEAPPSAYDHIHELIDAWSLLISFCVPIPRSKMVIFHENVTLGRKLGKGAFGEVFKGMLIRGEGKSPLDVAVKQVLGSATRSQIQEFCHEACVMSALRHRNIVALHGLASLRMPVMLVMEVVPGGDLRKHVQRSSAIPNQQMILFALDIARGMAHLASKGVLHRDLAARNCLITKSLVVKISDFGLSIVSNETIVKNLKKAPIRWLSPETLQKGVFNERTDVWSYGVLCTELLTRCANDPLWPRDLKECQKWIKESEHPHRVPNGLQPKELIEIVDMCCDKNPERRPNFKKIKNRVSDLYDKGQGSAGATKSSEAVNKASIRKPKKPSKKPSAMRGASMLSRKKSKDSTEQNSPSTRRASSRRKPRFSFAPSSPSTRSKTISARTMPTSKTPSTARGSPGDKK